MRTLRARLVFALPALVLSLFLAACGEKSASSSPVGTYVLVKDAALTDGIKGVAAHDSPDAAAEMVKGMIEKLEMSVALKADGTFTVSGNMGAKIDAAGTWTLEGGNLTMTSTHENGKARKDPEVNKMTYDGNTIRMAKDKSTPFEMVLRRK